MGENILQKIQYNQYVQNIDYIYGPMFHKYMKGNHLERSIK